MGSNAGGHVRVAGSIEYDDVGHPLLMGFGHRRCELHTGGGSYQHRLPADSLGNGAYQTRYRLVVHSHGQAGGRRAIAEHLEPIRERQERQIAAEVRDEDYWLAVTKLSLACEIDRLP